MPRRVAPFVLLALVSLAAPAAADEPEAPAAADRPARFSLGGGAGYPHIFHVDASVWLARQATVDARVWSGALIPRQGVELTVSGHVARDRWGAIVSGGGGVWREIPNTETCGLCTDARNDLYVRGDAGVGYLGRYVDVRAMIGYTTRPDFDSDGSITVHVTVMRRWPLRH
jgi:hypothetical protein